jgi:hypothetical protein
MDIPAIVLYNYCGKNTDIDKVLNGRFISLPGNNQIDDLYSYIMSLFAKDEVGNESVTYKT